jgi:plasmid stabilization system protein ParE
MKIIRDKKYLDELESILGFIAKDSFNRAMKFLSEVDKRINTIPIMPYKYRKSHYHNSKEVRDLIVKGYTIPYFVDESREIIVVLEIFKWSDR